MVAIEMDHDDDFDTVGLGCSLEHFTESEDVMKMIDNLNNIYNTKELEGQYDKLYIILKQYYEQPHLLDPYLEKILNKLISMIRNKESPVELKHATFTYMYQIIRVRGYKVVVKHLPHEVADLETVLSFLEEQNPEDKETWRSRFVLILWLSIIVIIPFHMERLDGFLPGEKDVDGNKLKSVMERIFNICKTYALVSDACSEANAFLTSKFLTRSDVKEKYLNAFFQWACDMHSNLHKESTIKYGALAAIAAVLKHGKREDLLPYAQNLLSWITMQNYKQHKAILVRKYGVKIVQRLGLTYLKPRVAAWRYTMGSRSLAANLGVVSSAAGDTPTHQQAPLNVDDDDQDIPEQVEEVVELLLCGLRDEDTIVRWSAAKGIGRMGARLGAGAAADVCDGVLALFQPQEREAAWHGGCMALAELARRGLLSPSQLGEAVKAVLAALRRDEPRAGGGRAARDAACHASWAFARAYDAQMLTPYALQLANALIATALFDREINCRRAASASYQENVGRHGKFPHGIDVLTTADFHAVGPRTNAYLTLAPIVAEFPEYTQPLVDHLVELKVEHWDGALRELAAKALNRLTDKLPIYIAETILPRLVTKTTSVDLNIRHGAILAIGEIMAALSVSMLPDGRTAQDLVSPEVLQAVKELVPRLSAKYQFRGLGGEWMRQACCECIRNLAVAGVKFHGDAVIDDWLNLIEECLSHEVPVIREKAIAALPVVFEQYLCGDGAIKVKREQLVHKYCQQLHNNRANGLLVRIGYARAIGSLPKFALQDNLEIVLTSLISCTTISEGTSKWAESRRDAIRGLTDVCQTVGLKGPGGVETYVGDIFEALLACLNEYTVDVRGDIGAWVREGSMTGLLSLCRQCANDAPRRNTALVIQRVMANVAQQAVEKIDRTRAHAGKIFTTLLYHTPKVDNIPHHEELMEIFPLEEIHLNTTSTTEFKDVEMSENVSESETAVSQAEGGPTMFYWLFPRHTMPRFVKLLDYDVYRYNVMLGLTVTAGDLTESLVKHTTQSLFSYLHQLHSDPKKLVAVMDSVVEVFAKNQRCDRVTSPMFKFLDRLLGSGAISPIIDDPESPFASNLLNHLKIELRGCKNMYKLLDSINVLCQLIQVGGQVCARSLGQLAIYLCYVDQYVRRCTSSRFYEALLLYGDMSIIPPDNIDEVMTILAETDWEKDVAQLKPIRNKLCDLMGIQKPVPVVRNQPAKPIIA